MRRTAPPKAAAPLPHRKVLHRGPPHLHDELAPSVNATEVVVQAACAQLGWLYGEACTHPGDHSEIASRPLFQKATCSYCTEVSERALSGFGCEA